MLDAVFEGDFLTLLSDLSDNSVDMLLTDPPYAQTKNHWDKPFDLVAFWQEANRVVKERGAMAVFATLPFGVDIIQANRRYFRYDWVWEKHNATGHLNANYEPMRLHENILIFGRKRPNYYPVMTLGNLHKRGGNSHRGSTNYGKFEPMERGVSDEYYPTTILRFAHEPEANKVAKDRQHALHATQKPVDLLAYLINTYTLPRQVVLDPFCGSGSTGVACVRTGRHYILGDSYVPFCELARQRLASPIQKELLT